MHPLCRSSLFAAARYVALLQAASLARKLNQLPTREPTILGRRHEIVEDSLTQYNANHDAQSAQSTPQYTQPKVAIPSIAAHEQGKGQLLLGLQGARSVEYPACSDVPLQEFRKRDYLEKLEEQRRELLTMKFATAVMLHWKDETNKHKIKDLHRAYSAVPNRCACSMATLQSA